MEAVCRWRYRKHFFQLMERKRSCRCVISTTNKHYREWESNKATIHSEASLTYIIPTTDYPINCNRNQIVFAEAEQSSTRTSILYVKNNTYHTIQQLRSVSLMFEMRSTQMWYSKLFVIDIFDTNDQREIVVLEYNRAHTAAQENVKQIPKDYYFPKILKLAKEIF